MMTARSRRAGDASVAPEIVAWVQKHGLPQTMVCRLGLRV